MKYVKNALFPIISFFATVVLTLISTYVVKLGDKGSFVVFATGASVSLAMTLIEQKISSELTKFRKIVSNEMKECFELFRLVKDIGDEQLEREVIAFARSLGAGEIPPQLASVRIPALYRTASKRVYASNVCKSKEDVLKWIKNARFKQIIELSSERSKAGVKLVRTFILDRNQICNSIGEWDPECHSTMCVQMDAGIEIRIIWNDDLNFDTILPTRRLDRNFTIFDEIEAVDTTDVQVIYRRPAKRLQEIIDLSIEQMKYSDAFDRAAPKAPININFFPSQQVRIQ